MLSLLQIRNFTIVEALDLEWSRGFTAITGETGAGKSIVVEALVLLLGGRGDSSAIRAGSDKAELTAEFDLKGNSQALAWLDAAGMDGGDVCLLRRVITDNGRSRAWINGSAVTLTQLQELGEHLVEIHGQNQHIRLTQTREQFRLLDSASPAGTDLATALRAVAGHHAAWKQTDQALQALQQQRAVSPDDLDLLHYQIEELEQSALTAETLAALESEHRLLARGSDVISSLHAALALLEADETGVVQQVHQALQQLEPHASLKRDIGNAAKALQEASINCEEARVSLQAAVSRIDLSPQRLAELDATLARLHDLARKHRVDVRQLGEVLVELKSRREAAANLDQRRRELSQRCAKHLQAYRQTSQELSRARQDRATQLCGAVTELMQVLGMAGGCFDIRITHDPAAKPSSRGDDQLEFLVSANPGIAPGPLRKIASGGELSRISLALKVAAAQGQTAPTQIFDEVDAGIGGATANTVGRLLQRVCGAAPGDSDAESAAASQALCVTHLAQVAVHADQQFRVVKRADDHHTSVDVHLLQVDERVDEIARMLGGTLTDQSRAHARELLGSGGQK